MILLRFDNRQPFGSREHFFHFAWGYLFPALAEIYRIESSSSTASADKKYLLQSCGPVMNEILDEMLKLHGYNYEILEEDSRDLDQTDDNFVTRWDIRLNEMAIMMNAGQVKAESHFLASLIQLKENTLARMRFVGTDEKLEYLDSKYLILKRSAQPVYYMKGGQAEIPGYGTARRELKGIEAAGNYLNERGIPTEVFEPGAHSFKDQIRVFQQCRGVIGIKGAEFANLIWMDKGSKVVQIRLAAMKTNNMQKVLADMLGLDFYEMVEDTEGSFPILKGEMLVNYLSP